MLAAADAVGAGGSTERTVRGAAACAREQTVWDGAFAGVAYDQSRLLQYMTP